MSTGKKIIMWILILVGMFILSDFLIYVGLNSNYKDIERKDSLSEVVIYQADATYVNGRIRGILKNTSEVKKNKYLKIELYSKRDVLLGKSYIEIKELDNEETQSFELLFRAKDVAYYKAEIVNQKDSGRELEIIPKELTKPEIILATAVTFLIFWG